MADEIIGGPAGRSGPSGRGLSRYQRQIVLPEVGWEGQQRLSRSRVLVVGAGALGSAAAAYLAMAGVGTIGLVDGDTVELSNLHRQLLHDQGAIGELKTASGARRLRAMNPDIEVEEYPEFLSSANALDLIGGFDLVVNGSDNFPTRYLVNDAAVLTGKPLVDAAILRFEGQLAVFRPGGGCYRCLFPSPPPPGMVPNCEDAGILGAVAGVMGSLEAVEALKLILSPGPPGDEGGVFLLYDALSVRFRPLAFKRDPACPVCGDDPTIQTLIDYEAFCGSPLPSRGASAPFGSFAEALAMTVSDAVRRLRDETMRVVDVRSADEYQSGHLPSAERVALDELARWAKARERYPGPPVLVVCAQGVRSAYAARYLRDAGIEAWSLSGGMAAWVAEGGEVSREDE